MFQNDADRESEEADEVKLDQGSDVKRTEDLGEHYLFV